MREVYPAEYFLIDFDQILEEAKQQETLLVANQGEYLPAKQMHSFFVKEVFPRIADNDWVFEAAQEFASTYALDCIHEITLTGQETYNALQNLNGLKAEILDLLARAKRDGYFLSSDNTELIKASDFLGLLNIERMPLRAEREARELYGRIKDYETLYLRVTLRALGNLYETILPRVMFVVRRAMITTHNLAQSPGVAELRGISELITWYDEHIPPSHPLYSVFGQLHNFYKIARNVSRHHKGLQWERHNNEVILQDTNTTIHVQVGHLLQKYRQLTSLCEFGVRGILYAFCDRDKGEIANQLLIQYIKIFPKDFPENERGIVHLYRIQTQVVRQRKPTK